MIRFVNQSIKNDREILQILKKLATGQLTIKSVIDCANPSSVINRARQKRTKILTKKGRKKRKKNLKKRKKKRKNNEKTLLKFNKKRKKKEIPQKKGKKGKADN